MRYADASQERRDNELKEFEIGADSVAITVESRAPKKTPTYMLPSVTTSLLVESSSGMMTSSSVSRSTLSPFASVDLC